MYNFYNYFLIQYHNTVMKTDEIWQIPVTLVFLDLL